MAIQKSVSWEKKFPLPVGERTVSFVVPSTLSVTNLATSDVLKVCQLPAEGVTVYDAFVQMADADTNATPTIVGDLVITDGTTTKVIIKGFTTGQAGGLVRPTKVPATEDGIGFTTNNKSFYIAINWTTGAATAAAVACNVGLTLSGFYLAGAVTE